MNRLFGSFGLLLAGAATFAITRPSQVGALEPNPGSGAGQGLAVILLFAGVVTLTTVFHSRVSGPDGGSGPAVVVFWLMIGIVSVLLVAFGAGQTSEDQATGSDLYRTLSPGELTFVLGALAVVSPFVVLIVAWRMVLRRFNADGRAKAEWHRWLEFAGPSVSEIALQWRAVGGASGEVASMALGHGPPIGRIVFQETASNGPRLRPPSVRAVNSLVGGHPIGMAFWLTTTAGKLALAGAKEVIATATESKEHKTMRLLWVEEETTRQRLLWEEARHRRLVEARIRLLDMMAKYDGRRSGRLFLRSTLWGRRWARGRARTRELLVAVEESLVLTTHEFEGFDELPE